MYDCISALMLLWLPTTVNYGLNGIIFNTDNEYDLLLIRKVVSKLPVFFGSKG